MKTAVESVYGGKEEGVVIKYNNKIIKVQQSYQLDKKARRAIKSQYQSDEESERIYWDSVFKMAKDFANQCNTGTLEMRMLKLSELLKTTDISITHSKKNDLQIQDDILDVYGDPKTFGKAIGGDICCNKKTILLLTALDTSDAESKAELLQWLMATDQKEEKIAAVTALYNRIGVREACEVVLEEYTSKALAQLDLLPANSATETLRELAEQLAIRKS